jgi:hypothetical protein
LAPDKLKRNTVNQHKDIQERQSFHEDLSRGAEIKLSADRTFGLAFGGFFALIGIWPLAHHGLVRWWALALSGGFILAALVVPSSLHPLNRAAARLSGVLHRVFSPLIAGLFFFAAITPYALLLRLGGKDLLRLRFDKKAGSYWEPRQPPGPDPESMANQF